MQISEKIYHLRSEIVLLASLINPCLFIFQVSPDLELIVVRDFRSSLLKSTDKRRLQNCQPKSDRTLAGLMEHFDFLNSLVPLFFPPPVPSRSNFKEWEIIRRDDVIRFPLASCTKSPFPSLSYPFSWSLFGRWTQWPRARRNNDDDMERRRKRRKGTSFFFL